MWQRFFEQGSHKPKQMGAILRPTALALVLAACVVAFPAYTAEEPDLIFRRSTVFKWLTPNDKLATVKRGWRSSHWPTFGCLWAA